MIWHSSFAIPGKTPSRRAQSVSLCSRRRGSRRGQSITPWPSGRFSHLPSPLNTPSFTCSTQICLPKQESARSKISICASGAAVSIVRADLTLDRGETTLLRASVDEKVRLPRRSEEATVRIPVEIRFEGGLLGALGAMGTLSSGARGTTVSGEVVLKAGMMRKKYKVERMDTDAFLRQFGIDLSEMMEEFGL